MNLFEIATRKKYRFPSVVGDLTVEQVWDLPLLARRAGQADLDSVARGIYADLKSVEDGSFVKMTPDPRKAELDVKLEVVKHIIAVKQAEVERATKAAERAEKRRRLVDALGTAEQRKLESKSSEELLAELAKLDEEA